MEPKELITTSLCKLGDEEKQIASTLHAMGIKGDKSEECSCVLAEYLKSTEFTTVSVHNRFVMCGPAHERTAVYFPSVEFKNLVARFDEGRYPFLLRSKDG